MNQPNSVADSSPSVQSTNHSMHTSPRVGLGQGSLLPSGRVIVDVRGLILTLTGISRHGDAQTRETAANNGVSRRLGSARNSVTAKRQ